MPGDLLIWISIFISTPLYSAVLAKFIYDYKTSKMQIVDVDTQKERIKILIICLVSLIPCPWYIGMFKLNITIASSNQPNNFIFILTNIIFNLSLNIIQCCEEICLFFISKDFRKLIKKQFNIKNEENSSSTTIVVGTAIKVEQNPQMYGQINN
uniref:Uncharacterized protein n=1 Tax=Meloidogyne enterolobii TaxID=390850 RepID=A0A6V7Y6B3_MELEN|nr:unnamed protein product [Meloidogyne enterolobii]